MRMPLFEAARIVEIRERTVPFKVNIRNAAATVSELSSSVVRWSPT